MAICSVVWQFCSEYSNTQQQQQQQPAAVEILQLGTHATQNVKLMIVKYPFDANNLVRVRARGDYVKISEQQIDRR